MEKKKESDELIEDLKTEADQVTVRIQVLKLEDSKQNTVNKRMRTYIYQVKLTDYELKGFLILRKSVKDEKSLLTDFELYLIDRVKLSFDRKKRIVLQSTQLTMIRVEEEDSQSVGSLELSQMSVDEMLEEEMPKPHRLEEGHREMSGINP